MGKTKELAELTRKKMNKPKWKNNMGDGLVAGFKLSWC